MSERSRHTGNVIATAIGLVLSVIFALMLAVNVTIIVKGFLEPDTPPSIFGITPMVVQSGSMSGSAPDHIEVGDLILIGPADPASIQVGDVISYSQNRIVVTHRVVEVSTDQNGSLVFTTKGDANNDVDAQSVDAVQVIGKYQTRIPGLGDFALFLQTPLGMALFIGLPVCAFILFDIVCRQRRIRREDERTAAMQAEIDRLRSQTDGQQ